MHTGDSMTETRQANLGVATPLRARLADVTAKARDARGEVGGSSPPPRIVKVTLGQKLGRGECPYIRRWVVEFPWFSIRLHHWLASDDARNFHDHPWWYVTLVLAGGYTDVSPLGERRMIPGRFAYRPAVHRHTVRVDRGGCWTLLITGPESRVWGFWVGGRFRKRNKYFFEHGHHPCSAGGAA